MADKYAISKKPIKIPILPWYHGPLSRSEAEELLLKSADGTYLIRESVNFPGDFTLCILCGKKVEHYRILYQDNKYSVDEEELFDSLEQLVLHYSGHEDGLCCLLKQPLEKQAPLVTPNGLETFQSSGWLLEGAELSIEGSIGRGGFAEVFKAMLNGVPVAAKCVKQLSACSITGLHEASAMTIAGIHPNLLRLIGIVTNLESNELFLITEFCPGGCLLNWLRTRGQALLTQRMQLSLAINVVSAVQYLQVKSLVHRDIACRNVFLSGEPGIAKLGDFGMCRPLGECERSCKLPVKWTAPEALRRNEFSFQSDIWSLGVLLWELYSFGRMPYPGIPVKDVIREIESGYRLPPPHNCPLPVSACMQDAWKLEPELRPTADKLLLQLNRLYNTLPD